MDRPELSLEFASEQQLRDQFDAELRRGGAFVMGETSLELGAVCELVLVHPSDGARLRLPARVVWRGERQGRIGVAVVADGDGEEVSRRIEQFIDEHAGAAAAGGEPPQRPSLHERIRGLSTVEQARLAREGDLSERVLLERLYGKAVWEPLLRNPRLTPPEVARIGRMGALPTPLVELIVQNASWLAHGPVRRALLSNPRVSGGMVTKVLQAMPKAELKLVPKQTAYTAQVRAAAQRLLRG